MKNILFSFILTFLVIQLSAQDGNAYYKKNVLSLVATDSTLNQEALFYKKKIVENLRSRNYRLRFNKNYSFYELERTMSVDINPVIDAMTNGVANFDGKIRTNASSGSSEIQTRFNGKTYRIKKDEIKWNLSNDVKTINQYKCLRATTERIIFNNEGEHKIIVTAWYAPEIPAPFGPDGFGGLPGLIVVLENNGTITKLNQLKLKKRGVQEIPEFDNGIQVSEEEYQTIISSAMKNRY